MARRDIGWLLLLASVAVAGCGEEATAERAAKAVRVETVTVQAPQAGSRYSANIEPRERVAAAFRLGGYVEQISQRRGVDSRPRNLQEGDTVRSREVLARLRDVEYRAKVEQARAAVSEARARLEKAKLDFDRASGLYADRSMTKVEYDAARVSLDIAEAAAAGADGQLGEATQALEDCVLRAPLDGVVLDRTVEVGALVGSGSPGFVVADVSSVKAVFGVPDQVVSELRTGQPLPVRIEVLGSGIYQGTVTSISPAADVQSRVFDVEVTIDNASGELKPGMIASVEVRSPTAVSETAGMPSLPLSSVVKSETGGYAVFVVDRSGEAPVARARPVELGAILGNRIAVRDGVQIGETIVSSGSSFLVDGDAVVIIP